MRAANGSDKDRCGLCGVSVSDLVNILTLGLDLFQHVSLRVGCPVVSDWRLMISKDRRSKITFVL